MWEIPCQLKSSRLTWSWAANHSHQAKPQPTTTNITRRPTPLSCGVENKNGFFGLHWALRWNAAGVPTRGLTLLRHTQVGRDSVSLLAHEAGLDGVSPHRVERANEVRRHFASTRN